MSLDTVVRWLDDRIGFEALRHVAEKKTVPVNRHTPWYYFGGMTLFFFIVQVATGILLMLYYRPSAEGAYESVQFLMTQVPFGWLIRSIHSWSANLMVLAAFVHLFSVFFLKAYRAPRELTWLSGFVLLVLAMAFGFSGYLLPWNKLAFFATKVGTDIAGSVPIVGGFILRFLRGGDHVTGGTLSRFYGVHVAILPAVTTALLALHLILVQKHGMSVPPSIERSERQNRPMPFVPDFLLRDLFGWTLALAVLAALAALFPWELGEKADPFAPAFANIKPEWYFMFMFQVLKYVPGGEILGIVENEAIAIMGFGLMGLLAFLTPFLDKRVMRDGKSPLFTIAGVIALLFIVILTCVGYHAWWPAAAAIALGVIPWLAGRLAAGGRTDTLAILFVASAAALVLSAPAARAEDPSKSAPPAHSGSTCLTCHQELDGNLLEPTQHWEKDVHAAAGFSCVACHGGDPTSEDPEVSMSPAKGFRPAPTRLQIADFCARCHSDAVFMKKYNPQARVDQLTEYRTSVHGQLNAKGDPVPATCTDCHGAHGVLPVTSPNSPVYATNVPEMCARCHSDANVMSSYGIPTNQYEHYRRSAHAAALFDAGDVAAPACNDCHGNHGAAPPGVGSVANVCGQCHGREQNLFTESFKADLFQEMGVSQCSVCHEHHMVLHPTPELFNSEAAPVVSQGEITEKMPFAAELGALEAGGKAEAVWRTVLRPHVEADDKRLGHSIEISAEGLESPLVVDATVRPGVQPPGSLVRQATAGPLTATVEIEPLSGTPVVGGDAMKIRLAVESTAALAAVSIHDRPGDAVDPLAGSACLTCHAPGDPCDQATVRMYGALSSLDRELRTAGELLHRAEVAGMEVSEPRFELTSKGKTATVESRALIHSFDPDRLIARTDEGMEIASAALAAGKQALAEIKTRRTGLLVSLVLVAVLLVLLRIKIRQVEATRRVPAGGR